MRLIATGILAPCGAPALLALLLVSACTHPRAREKSSATEPTLAPKFEVVRAGCGMPKGLAEADWPTQLQPASSGAPPLPEEGALTLAVLPDTQYYSACLSELLRCQADWVAADAARRNIAFALSLGDLTEHNTKEEWDYVRRSLSPLASTVPLVLASGNHDHGLDGSADRRSTRQGEAFPEAPPAARTLLAETMRPSEIENAYYRLRLDRYTLGVLVLEWSPRDMTVSWANDVMTTYAGDRVILITHAYVYHDESRYNWDEKGAAQKWNPRSYGTALRDPALPPGAENWDPAGANDGEMLWDKLVRQHPGFFLTLSGHVLGDGQGLVSSRADHGNLVHQMLVNYQMLDRGGLGYLRLVELSADGTRMTMSSYSPALDLQATAEDQRFVLPIEPGLFTGIERVGYVNDGPRERAR